MRSEPCSSQHCCRFQPGPALQPVEPAQALDLASSSGGGGKELWLMQLPLDVRERGTPV